jgi:hypothetical protein
VGGDLGVPGLNYGWAIVEGNACHNPSVGCNTSGLTPPAVVYRTGIEGRSVIGGYVYRGSAVRNLGGTYFYADFFSNWIRSFRMVGGIATDKRDWTASLGSVTSVAGFGEDGDGELYIVSITGSIHKIVPRT